MLCGRAPRPPGAVRVTVHGKTHVFGPGGPALLFADDSIAQARQRAEALALALAPGAGGGGVTRVLDAAGNELPYALDLLGARDEIRLEGVGAADEAGTGDDARDERRREADRQREIADLLARARSGGQGQGQGLTACRYLAWTQRVAPPASAPKPLEALYGRVETGGGKGLLMARLVTWRGGEPTVRVKHDPERMPVAALRGFQPDADVGDVLELRLAMPVGGPAAMAVAPDGGYRLVATASTYDAAGDDALRALQAAAAAAARRLGLRPPNAEADLEAATLEAELRAAGRPPDVGALRAAADAAFYPLFAAEARRMTVVLRYKRVAGFDDGARVREWLADHAGDAALGTRAALAAELRRTFLSLTAAEAAALAADPPPPPRKGFRGARGARPAGPGDVEVTLAPARDFFGFRVVARGVQSLEQWRQLQADVRAVVAADAPGRNRATPESFDLAEDEPPATKPAAAAEAAASADDAQLKRGDIVKRLYEADRDLFQLRGKEDIYARHCGLHEMRQPVVIRGKAAAAKAGVPSVAYGSTPERAAENAYACPAIWCPQSAVALAPKPHPLFGPDGQRKAVPPEKAAAIERAYQAQYVCPNAAAGGERPLFLYASTYWNHNPAQPRHVGFHSTRKSASGLCLPCCFKLPKDRVVRECAPAAAAPNAEAEDDGDDGNDKYVLGDAVVPIKAGRLGALPRAFRALLPPGGYVAKGFAPRGRHLLREGIASHRPSSLVAAVAALAGLPSAGAFADDVAKRLTLAELVALENGQLLLRLLASAGPTTEADARAAQTRPARAWLGEPAGGAATPAEAERRVALWRGFRAFLAYLRGPAVDARLLYDLVARLHGFALGVLEADGDRVWFDCPSFVGYERKGDVPFGLLLKQGATHEPLVLADVNRTSVAATRVVPAGDPAVARLLGRLVASCKLDDRAHDGRTPLGDEKVVDALVLRRDMLLVGAVVDDDLFVPFEPPLPSGHLGRLLAAHPQARLAHLEDLDAEGLRAPRDLAAALRRAAPASRPATGRGGVVGAYDGVWRYEPRPGGRYAPVTTRPVGPNFYAVPSADDRTRWTEAARRAEGEYQAWKRAMGQKAKGMGLAKLAKAAAAERGAPFWAARLAYELATGRDVGPAAESAVRLADAGDVSQTDLETLRFSRTPVLGTE